MYYQTVRAEMRIEISRKLKSLEMKGMSAGMVTLELN
jgi:hypothetical protein